MWFRGHNHLAFENLTIGPEVVSRDGEDVTIEWCTIGNDSLAINAAAGESNSNNTELDDRRQHDRTHRQTRACCWKAKTSRCRATRSPTPAWTTDPVRQARDLPEGRERHGDKQHDHELSEDGVSARYRNSTVADNYIAGGPIGIAWFQYDTIAGTSHWTGNTIVDTSTAGFYVSESNIGGATRESFVIEHNTLQPAAGVFMNLQPTAGSYTVRENIELEPGAR